MKPVQSEMNWFVNLPITFSVIISKGRSSKRGRNADTGIYSLLDFLDIMSCNQAALISSFLGNAQRKNYDKNLYAELFVFFV
jgi:hypothetical protein